jgi:hypothetical protein
MRLCVLIALIGGPFDCSRVPKVSSERLAAMQEVKDEESVRNCLLLGRYLGYSTQVGDVGLTQAREEARAKAAATEATEFFFDSESVGPDVITVAVKAYDCGPHK